MRFAQLGLKPRYAFQCATQLLLKLEADLLLLRLLVVGFVQASVKLVTPLHQSFSRLVHLLADPGDITIGFLLSSMTGPYSLKNLGLQMFD